jgi:hypothetical protein
MKYQLFIGSKLIGEYSNRLDVLIARRAMLNTTRYRGKNVCARRIKGIKRSNVYVMRVHKKECQVFRCIRGTGWGSTAWTSDITIYPWWYKRTDKDYLGKWWYEV